MPLLDLDEVPESVRVLLEAAVEGAPVTLAHSGREIGTLEFRSNVVEGTVISAPEAPEGAATREGVTVVATAMKLSAAGLRRLADEFGSDYLVLDLHDAPETADVLLTHPVSPQLLGILRMQFPNARVLITEIEDEEYGIHYSGPVSRLLDAGASAYLPPRPVGELAAHVHAYLSRSVAGELEAGPGDARALPGG
ncbi:MAG: hypothetical protein V9G04_04255 [Nocardioides sp.]